ncbi:MAG: NADH-quinone oxidoreductase subunit M [Candidatus Dormibacteraeota bacterium]|nr:NADH-quinone oxidoreductase subunit M [Candidatus Dormibacteraeota bacterium]
MDIAAATIHAASPTPSPISVPGSGIFSSSLLLSIIVWTPAAVAAVIAILPNPRGRYDVLMKQIAFFTNLGLLFILWVAYNQFQNFLPNMQFEEKAPWLPPIGATYHLGIDGPGLLMLVLSGLVGLSSVLASFGIRERVRSYFCLLLLSETCVSGAIVSHDLFVLVLFWGAGVIPVALLILGWGGPRRETAVWRLVGYWGVGTIALLIATMALYAAAGARSFDMDVVLKTTLSPRVQLAVGVALLVAGATRLPLFPFHGWVRAVYSEAPVGVSVVVAGVASRLGAYVLLRVLVGAEPVGAQLISPLVAVMAAVTVVYAGLLLLRSTDIRHAAAQLAMVPGGITMLGLAALSPLAIAGSVLSLFSGGLAAALIVGVCATLAERAQSRSLLVLRGLASRMPATSWILLLAVFGLLGVPLMASYPALGMTLFGSLKNQPVGAFAVAAGLAVVAIGLSAVVHRVLFGSPNPDAPGVSDVSLGETWFLALLAGGLLWVGVFPGGPKLPGTDAPLFDPGLINNMAAGLSDMAAPYAAKP